LLPRARGAPPHRARRHGSLAQVPLRVLAQELSEGDDLLRSAFRPGDRNRRTNRLVKETPKDRPSRTSADTLRRRALVFSPRRVVVLRGLHVGHEHPVEAERPEPEDEAHRAQHEDPAERRHVVLLGGATSSNSPSTSNPAARRRTSSCLVKSKRPAITRASPASVQATTWLSKIACT